MCCKNQWETAIHCIRIKTVYKNQEYMPHSPSSPSSPSWYDHRHHFYSISALNVFHVVLLPPNGRAEWIWSFLKSHTLVLPFLKSVFTWTEVRKRTGWKKNKQKLLHLLYLGSRILPQTWINGAEMSPRSRLRERPPGGLIHFSLVQMCFACNKSCSY